MSRTLVLQIPEATWIELEYSARASGKPPEIIAAGILTDNLDDPLMKLAGAFSSPLTDVAEKHDEYLGKALFRSCRDTE